MPTAPLPAPSPATLRRGGLAVLVLSATLAAPALAAPPVPAPGMPSNVERAQYYCPPGYRFSYRRDICVPAGPPPRYYAPPPPPPYYPPRAYYAPPPPPRYYRPQPGVGLFFNY